MMLVKYDDDEIPDYSSLTSSQCLQQKSRAFSDTFFIETKRNTLKSQLLEEHVIYFPFCKAENFQQLKRVLVKCQIV